MKCYVIVVCRFDWVSEKTHTFGLWSLCIIVLNEFRNYNYQYVPHSTMWSPQCGQWTYTYCVWCSYIGNYRSIASDNIQHFCANSNYFETYNNRFIKYVFNLYTYDIYAEITERMLVCSLVRSLVCSCYCWENRIEWCIHFPLNLFTFCVTHKSTKIWALKMQGEKIDCIPLIAIHLKWRKLIESENVSILHIGRIELHIVKYMQWWRVFKHHDQKFWLKLVDCCADALHSLSMKTGLNLTIDQPRHFVVLYNFWLRSLKKTTTTSLAITNKQNKIKWIK